MAYKAQLSDSNISQAITLPYELIRDIFELAAKTQPGAAARFALVSSCVQEWMEAIMYETVVLDLPVTKINLFLRTFDARPATFFAKNVKQLYLSTMVSFTAARRILSACTGIANVACWADARPEHEALSYVLPSHHIEKLSVKIETLWGLSSISRTFSADIFPNLTHFEIVNPPTAYSNVNVDWDGLCALPHLTHIAFGALWAGSHTYIIDVAGKFLAESKSLQTLVLISDDPLFIGPLEKEQIMDDERVVVLSCFYWPAASEDAYWQDVRRGGPDFWLPADEIVRKRKCLTG